MPTNDNGTSRRSILKATAAGLTAGVGTVASSGSATAAGDTIYTTDSFVDTSGTDFTLDGSTWRWSGTNNFWLMGDSGVDFDAYFQMCVDHNVEVVRTWAFHDILSDETWWSGGGSNWEPGGDSYGLSHDSEGFDRLDRLVKSAADHGVRLVLSLENYWTAYGGMPQWIRWYYEDYLSDGAWQIPDDYSAGDSSTVWFDDSGTFSWSREAFFRHDELRTRYEDFVNTVLWHSNSYRDWTSYKDDPAIMLWELANEPHVDYAAFEEDRGGDGSRREWWLNDWIGAMSSHLKSISSNQLVSTGHEGYYTYKGNDGWESDHGTWLYDGTKGADYSNNHDHPDVDAATFHMYPNHWGIGGENEGKQDGIDFGEGWIAEHKSDGDGLGIPTYAGEFGWELTYQDSDNMRTDIYDAWYQELDTGGTAGALIWQFQNHENFDGDGYRFDENWRAADQMQKYGASVHDPGSTYQDWTWW